MATLRWPSVRPGIGVCVRLAMAFACLPAFAALAQDGPPGILAPIVLPPFDAAAPACQRPPALDRELVFLQDNQREFMQGVESGLAAAAADRKLAFSVALANNDAGLMRRQAGKALAAKSGAVVVAPIDPRTMTRPLQEIIWAGAYVGAVVPPPATTILNAPQYETGKVLGEAAAD